MISNDAAYQKLETRQACYSKSEAADLMGTTFLTATDLPGVPEGTQGLVVDVENRGARGWVLCVQWDLPPRRSEVMAQIGDLSFNLPWRTKRPLAEFSKSEVERLLSRRR